MYLLQFTVITLVYTCRRVFAMDAKQNLTVLESLLRMQLTIFDLKKIETLVDTICHPSCRIVVVSAQGWNDPQYYPDYSHYQGGFHHHPHPNTQQQNYNQESQSSYTTSNYHQQQNCECKRLKDCPQMLEKIYQSNQAPSDWLLANFQDSQCGYYPNDPIVCCTTYVQTAKPAAAKSTTEKPWIWDITHNVPQLPKRKPNNNFEQSYERWDHTQFNKFTATTTPKITRSKHNNNHHQHKLTEDDYRFNLIDFEDPDTHKNCPPSFNDEFEAPNGNNLPSTQKRAPPNKSIQNRKQSSTSGFRGTSKTPSRRRFQNQANQINGQNQKVVSRLTKKRLVNAPHCGVSVNTRIVGGREIAPGQFPWMARLAYRNRTSGKLTYRCAGSVISDRYIVTAAHCVTNLVSSLEVFLVRVGELDTNRNLDCESNPVTCVVPQDYDIQKIIPHAQYDTPKYANDIALIRLVRPVNATQIIPICLPIDELSSADKQLTGKIGIIAGWGSKTSGIARQTASLQYVTLPIVNRTICAASYAQFSANSRTPIIVSQAQICAQGMENMDACQGDSGGPLMVEGTATNARFTLLGLVSFGPRTCGVSNFPGVYTRISSYFDWIVDNMEL